MLMRFSYCVQGPVKFLSHLDLLKLFGKAVKRAGVPIAYSEGFNPHPKITFGPPRGVAIAGLEEYCDMKLKEEMQPEDFIQAFNAALPKGIAVKEAKLLRHKAEALMAVINVAAYQAAFIGEDTEKVAAAVKRLLAAEQAMVIRYNPKKKDKEINVRAGIDTLALTPAAADSGQLDMRLLFGESGSVKPTEVLSLLLQHPEKAVITRTGLYVKTADGALKTP